MFLTDEICKRDNFGIGEDLFFPGLFTQRPGENANLPIVRIGNIAAMPEESVRTTWGVLPRAYLIEARSIGGLSGSPVFWNRGSIRQLTVGIEPPTGARLNFYFLGLIHGHYDIRGEDWDSNDETSIDTAAQTCALNMGIAIVIPASDVLATLNEPIFLDQREIIRREVLVQTRLSLPVPDVIAEVPDEMLIQNDTTARTHSLFDVSDSAPKDAGDLSPESKEPPMNP